MTSIFHGVIPALMTEMHQDGALDHEATSRHLESCLAAGVNGFVMLGTLGENSSLSADEKDAVVRNAVATVNGRAPIIAGVAEYTTDLAIATAKRFKAAGADGIMALPTMVYQQDAREGEHHFRTLARNTDLPIMIYNNRPAYKLDLLPESFAALADEKNIVAVKESSHDSRRITDMINLLGNRFEIVCGVAVGWVSGLTNSFPRESVEMYRLATTGRTAEALELYRWFMPMLHLDVAIKLVQYIKLVNQLAGEGSEWVRPPRLPLIGEERQKIEDIVNHALATRPKFARAA